METIKAQSNKLFAEDELLREMYTEMHKKALLKTRRIAIQEGWIEGLREAEKIMWEIIERHNQIDNPIFTDFFTCLLAEAAYHADALNELSQQAE